MAATTYDASSFYTGLSKAGWKRNFDISGGGHYCVPVSGAPSLGSSPGGLLFAGAWTKQDGTTLFQRSNMDRSVTTIIIDPYGNTTHNLKHATLIESVDYLRTLNL